MKAKDTDILIVPGLGGADAEHWLSRWSGKLSTARRVEQADWDKPDADAWSSALAESINRSASPVVLVAHGLGIATAMRALPKFDKPPAGGFFVAPHDLSDPKIPPRLKAFGPYSREPLPFPSVTIGSRNDPLCSHEVAEDIAAAWGSLFVDAGEVGGIDPDSGYGPWPEGSMAFARFLSRL